MIYDHTVFFISYTIHIPKTLYPTYTSLSTQPLELVHLSYDWYNWQM